MLATLIDESLCDLQLLQKSAHIVIVSTPKARLKFSNCSDDSYYITLYVALGAIIIYVFIVMFTGLFSIHQKKLLNIIKNFSSAHDHYSRTYTM